MNRRLLSAVVVSVALVGQVQAVPTILDFDVTGGGGSVLWEGIDDEFADSDFNLNLPTTGDRAIAINDAETTNNDDAYDDAFAVAVNGMLIDDDDNIVDVTAGALGTSVVADPVLPTGFAGGYELFFFESDPIVRLLFSVMNVGIASSDALIEIATDFGSDGDHLLEADGSGNGIFGVEDDFAVFSDLDDDDPNLLFTFFGAGASETPTMNGIFDNDDLNSLFDLTLAPGETQSLLLFGGVYDNVLSSIMDAAILGETLTGSLASLGAGGFLTGLSDQQIASIVNYGQPSAVPEPSTLALLGVGLLGLGFARRRRAA